MAERGEQILNVAESLLEKRPQGFRYTELCEAIHKATSLNKNTIRAVIIGAPTSSKLIKKPSRGLYVHVEHVGNGQQRPKKKMRESVKEESFYASFADFIVGDMEEVTKAIPLGRAKFGKKWGTPDVIGRKDAARGDIVKMQTEIVSAEIKTNTNDLVTGFGQACAYCLFSHKSYLVVPDSSGDEEIQRLDSLCQVFGIGLVLFDSEDKIHPGFSVQLRAQRQSPDYSYMNRYLKLIEKELFLG